MTSIPADAQTGEGITNAILTAIRPGLERLFGTEDIHIKDRRMVLAQRIGKNKQVTIQVTSPYVQWALDNGITSISLGEGQRRLEKRRYIYEQHIAGNKRWNLIKKACFSIVNGIHPCIDRILNEVHKLVHLGYIHDEVTKNVKYQYTDELVITTNEHSDILVP